MVNLTPVGKEGSNLGSKHPGEVSDFSKNTFPTISIIPIEEQLGQKSNLSTTNSTAAGLDDVYNQPKSPVLGPLNPTSTTRNESSVLVASGIQKVAASSGTTSPQVNMEGVEAVLQEKIYNKVSLMKNDKPDNQNRVTENDKLGGLQLKKIFLRNFRNFSSDQIKNMGLNDEGQVREEVYARLTAFDWDQEGKELTFNEWKGKISDYLQEQLGEKKRDPRFIVNERGEIDKAEETTQAHKARKEVPEPNKDKIKPNDRKAKEKNLSQQQQPTMTSGQEKSKKRTAYEEINENIKKGEEYDFEDYEKKSYFKKKKKENTTKEDTTKGLSP